MSVHKKLSIIIWSILALCLWLAMIAFDPNLPLLIVETLGKWSLHQSKHFFDLGSNTFRNVMLVFAAIVTAIFAWRRANAAEGQNTISENGLNIDRFQKGAEMLGSEKLAVRTAGVQVLEQLFRLDSASYAKQVILVLSTFIQARSTRSSNKPSGYPPLESLAAFKAISHMNEWFIGNPNSGLWRIDCRNIFLPSSHLISLDLRKFYLANSDFEESILRNSNLSEAVLSNANFKAARLQFAKLVGADVRKANFSRALLDNTDFAYVKNLQSAEGLNYDQLSKAKNVNSDFLEELRLKEVKKSTEN